MPQANIKNRTEIEFDAPLGPATDIDDEEDTAPSYDYYETNKVLGKLHVYRNIDEKQIWDENVKFPRVARPNDSIWKKLRDHLLEQAKDKHIALDSTESMKDEAWNIRNLYVLTLLPEIDPSPNSLVYALRVHICLGVSLFTNKFF